MQTPRTELPWWRVLTDGTSAPTSDIPRDRTMETLEDRLLLSFSPTGLEQEMLELINRMRMNPAAELEQIFISTEPGDPNYFVSHDPHVNAAFQFFGVDPAVLLSQWASLNSAPPLAWNEALYHAATQHNQLMIQQDVQSHQLPGEPTLLQRAVNAGYNWTGSVSVGENVFAYSESVFHGHAAFAIDWGNTATGIQSPPGHRENIMDATYREIGISVIHETNAATSVGPYIVTQDFGVRGNYGNPRVLGVLFNDADQDRRYDAGEGVGGLTITIQNANLTYSTTSMTAGGYQVEVAPGTYSVYASGPGIGGTLLMGTVIVDSSNVKFDFDLSSNQSPQSGTVTGFVFRDLNEDGTKGGTETGLAGWRVFIDRDGNGSWGAGEESTTTSATGQFTLAGIPAGTVQLAIVEQWTYRGTTPTTRSATVVANQTTQGADFGQFQYVLAAGSNLTVYGTAGNDQLAWTAGTSHVVTLNGKSFMYDATTTRNLFFEGRGGADTLHLILGAGNDSAVILPQHASVNSSTYAVVATTFETVYANANSGGTDRVELFDALTDDRLYVRPTYALMRALDSSFYHYASGFDEVYANANKGGVDYATMIDSAGNDRFTSRPTSSTLRSLDNSYFAYASRFDNVYAYSENGGNDEAYLYDSAGDDRLTSYHTHSILFAMNNSYFNYASGFDKVYAIAEAGGADYATMIDSPGDDRLVAQPGSSMLTDVNGSFTNHATGFDRVFVHAQNGGADHASLYDSAGDDRYTGMPTYSLLRAVDENYYNYASGFDEVLAVSTLGGSDQASLYDSSGDDRFTGRPELALLRGVNGSYYNIAVGFDRAYAFATSGGHDEATFYDSSGDDLLVARPDYSLMWRQDNAYYNYASGFDRTDSYANTGGIDNATLIDSSGDDRLLMYPTWSALYAVNNSFYNYANGFERVQAVATSGGDDFATMYDSAGDDRFLAHPGYSSLWNLSNTFYNYASGFDRVYAHAIHGGFDVANMYDSTAKDYFSGRPEFSILQAADSKYYNYAAGFDEVFADATLGGDDVAFLHDSAGNDLLFGRGNFAELSGTGFKNRAIGFGQVQAHGSNGGTNTKDVQDVDYILQLFGSWI